MARNAYEKIRGRAAEDPVLQAAGVTGGLGLGALGASYLGSRLPRVPQETHGLADAFLRVKDITDPVEFAHAYATRGSHLTQAPALVFPSGQVMTGRDVALRARSSLPARALARAGVVPKVRGADSVQHYNEFARGPARALDQMKRETGLLEPNLQTILSSATPEEARVLEQAFRPAVTRNYPKLIRPLQAYGHAAEALGRATPILRHVGAGALGLGAAVGLGRLLSD